MQLGLTGPSQTKCENFEELGLAVTFSNPDRLIEALRATLLEVEQESGVSMDDPALLALKHIVLQRIADLELSKATEAAAVDGNSDLKQSAESGEISRTEPGGANSPD